MAREKKNVEKVVGEIVKKDVEKEEVKKEDLEPYTDFDTFTDEVAQAVKEGRVTKLSGGIWRVWNK